MLDFNLTLYAKFIECFKRRGFNFFPLYMYNTANSEKMILLRHDVDRHTQNALKMAEVETSLGISGTYYFRINNGIRYNQIVKKIVELGHEVGYHYEEIFTMVNKFKKTAIKKNMLYIYRDPREIHRQ